MLWRSSGHRVESLGARFGSTQRRAHIPVVYCCNGRLHQERWLLCPNRWHTWVRCAWPNLDLCERCLAWQWAKIHRSRRHLVASIRRLFELAVATTKCRTLFSPMRSTQFPRAIWLWLRVWTQRFLGWRHCWLMLLEKPWVDIVLLEMLMQGCSRRVVGSMSMKVRYVRAGHRVTRILICGVPSVLNVWDTYPLLHRIVRRCTGDFF